MSGSYRLAIFLVLLAVAGCGMLVNREPEGFTVVEWTAEQNRRTSLAQAHRWINQKSSRRKQRGLAVEACYRAYAFCHAGPGDLLEDFPRRKIYYHQINSTWLPELALKAQRGEGDFGSLLAQALENEVHNCWNAKAAESLHDAARKIRAL